MENNAGGADPDIADVDGFVADAEEEPDAHAQNAQPVEVDSHQRCVAPAAVFAGSKRAEGASLLKSCVGEADRATVIWCLIASTSISIFPDTLQTFTNHAARPAVSNDMKVTRSMNDFFAERLCEPAASAFP